MRCAFTWSIENFSCYFALKNCGDTIYSSVFKTDELLGTKWYMSLFPQGQLSYEDFVSVHLTQLFSVERDLCYTKLKCKISIIDADSHVWCYKEVDRNFDECDFIQFDNFVERCRILEEEVKVLPGDILTITCQICAYNERNLELRSRNEVEISTNELKNLSKDLKILFDSGRFSDVSLIVRGVNIPSHKAILCARSPVFEERFQDCPSIDHINIPDIDKSTMDALLTFIYSGKIDLKVALSSLALYDAAERYGIQDLSFCLAPQKIFTVTETAMKRYTFTWRLSSFSSVTEKYGRMVYSDKFHIESSSSAWNISLHFYEISRDEEENIGIYLNRLWSALEQRPVLVNFNVHLVDQQQNRHYTMNAQKCFKPSSRHGFPFFLKKSNLLRERNEFLPYDILTVCCELIVYNGKYVSSTKHSYYSPNSNMLEIDYTKNVSQSFKTLLLNKVASDLKVRCAGRSFDLHRAILCARSTVFADLLENVNNDTMDILDVEPSILELLFTFIYTGEIVDLKEGMAPDLYKVADTYNITDLKHACSTFLQSNVTLNNACEMLALSHSLDDEMLKHFVKDFMCLHANDLLVSRHWQNFAIECPHLANEILTFLSMKYCEAKRRRLI